MERQTEKETGRQTRRERHFGKRTPGCGSLHLWELGRGAAPAPHRGLSRPSAPHGLWPTSDLHPHSLEAGNQPFLHLPPMSGAGWPAGSGPPAADIN